MKQYLYALYVLYTLQMLYPVAYDSWILVTLANGDTNGCCTASSNIHPLFVPPNPHTNRPPPLKYGVTGRTYSSRSVMLAINFSRIGRSDRQRYAHRAGDASALSSRQAALMHLRLLEGEKEREREAEEIGQNGSEPRSVKRCCVPIRGSYGLQRGCTRPLCSQLHRTCIVRCDLRAEIAMRESERERDRILCRGVLEEEGDVRAQATIPRTKMHSGDIISGMG